MTDSGSTSFEAFFKRTVNPLIVLSALKDGPKYGYEISTSVQKKSDGQYFISVMYPILYRLTEQGYVTVSSTEVVDGRARSYYSITEEGREYLDRKLTEFETLYQVFTKLTEEE